LAPGKRALGVHKKAEKGGTGRGNPGYTLKRTESPLPLEKKEEKKQKDLIQSEVRKPTTVTKWCNSRAVTGVWGGRESES